ncbi:rhodanese-like domain-containing protein [Marinicella sp. W31]|uniref:rhodanese-like domain-containing protein n=1 Tax=Marinicella sp. W31 TaxID=3023713 RepID=UPI003757A8FB
MSPGLKLTTIVFVVLGVVAIVIGDRKPLDLNDPALSFAEFDEIIQTPVSTMTALELAEYLMAQEHHYNLIDLQDQAQYRIPTADVDSISGFLEKDIPVNETIIVYAETETKALQLYYLLIIRGYFKVHVLEGGLKQWYVDILNPEQQKIAVSEFEKRQKITEFFGGVFKQDGYDFTPRSIQLEKKNKSHHGC